MTSSAEISDRLAKCFSSVIHDVMRDDGFKNFVLNPRIKPNKEKETVFTPIARGVKIEAPEKVDMLDDILPDTFKKHYFSEIKNKKN